MAATINRIAGYPTSESPADPRDAGHLIVYGDQSDGASVLFYTRRQALLVNGTLVHDAVGIHVAGCAARFYRR